MMRARPQAMYHPCVAGKRDKHEILPKRDSARREKDGQAANLLSPFDYPAVAECQCGQPCRCERMYFANWEHAETRTPGEEP